MVIALVYHFFKDFIDLKFDFYKLDGRNKNLKCMF